MKHDLTIQDEVLSLVNRDPFLTLREIATQCETTDKYVRNVLSTHDMSLH